MKDKTYHAYLDSHERQLVIHSLVELKNRLIQEGRYTDCVHIAAYSYSPKSKRLFCVLSLFYIAALTKRLNLCERRTHKCQIAK